MDNTNLQIIFNEIDGEFQSFMDKQNVECSLEQNSIVMESFNLKQVFQNQPKTIALNVDQKDQLKLRFTSKSDYELLPVDLKVKEFIQNQESSIWYRIKVRSVNNKSIQDDDIFMLNLQFKVKLNKNEESVSQVIVFSVDESEDSLREFMNKIDRIQLTIKQNPKFKPSVQGFEQDFNNLVDFLEQIKLKKSAKLIEEYNLKQEILKDKIEQFFKDYENFRNPKRKNIDPSTESHITNREDLEDIDVVDQYSRDFDKVTIMTTNILDYLSKGQLSLPIDQVVLAIKDIYTQKAIDIKNILLKICQLLPVKIDKNPEFYEYKKKEERIKIINKSIEESRKKQVGGRDFQVFVKHHSKGRSKSALMMEEQNAKKTKVQISTKDLKYNNKQAQLIKGSNKKKDLKIEELIPSQIQEPEEQTPIKTFEDFSKAKNVSPFDNEFDYTDKKQQIETYDEFKKSRESKNFTKDSYHRDDVPKYKMPEETLPKYTRPESNQTRYSRPEETQSRYTRQEESQPRYPRTEETQKFMRNEETHSDNNKIKLQQVEQESKTEKYVRYKPRNLEQVEKKLDLKEELEIGKLYRKYDINDGPLTQTPTLGGTYNKKY